jgi:translation initiation factor IF-3
VRLIDDTGKQVGVIPIGQALSMAQERDLDLVEVAPGAKPPVCRLLNYGKFLYEKTKKDRLARKSQKMIEIKEIRMRPQIGEHDLAFKSKRVREFLADGAKVRLRVRFRGRERSYPEIGRDLLQQLGDTFLDVATIEQMPTIEEGARSVYMMLAPKPGARRQDSQPLEGDEVIEESELGEAESRSMAGEAESLQTDGSA